MKRTLSLFLSFVMLLSVVTGLTFTASADDKISSVEIYNVTAPTIGAKIGDITYCTIHDYAGCDFFGSYYWTDAANPSVKLAADTVCLEGHTYSFNVPLHVTGNNRFATPLSATVNGAEATVNSVGGRYIDQYVNVVYTFPKLSYSYISSVQLNGDVFEKGAELKNDFFYCPTEGIDKAFTVFTRNGEVLSSGEKVTYGDYSVSVVIVPKDNYRFTDSVTVKSGAKTFEVTKLGLGIIAKYDDYAYIECTHSYSSEYSYDLTSHWKACSECGDKTSLGDHSFNTTTEDGNTVYTCAICGFKKTQKNYSGSYYYAEVQGGVEITAYNGSDVDVIVPDNINGLSVVGIAPNAFSKYENKTTFKSITLPETVTVIGNEAFVDCTALESVNIPSGVKVIGGNAFKGCSSLKSITIPYGVTQIKYGAFQSCTAIKEIVIPCSVKEIGNSAFAQCTSIESIVVPDSVSSIGSYTFQGDSALKYAELGDGISSLGSSFFDSCSALTTVVLPSALKTVATYAFADTALTAVKYRGTQDEWNSINIYGSSTSNKKLTAAELTTEFKEKTDVGQHKYVKLDAVEATCIGEGYTLNVCEGCGNSFKSGVTPATGIHNYNSGNIVAEPTCTEAGQLVKACKVCGATLPAEAISPLGHDFSGNAQYCKNECGTANPNYVAPVTTKTTLTLKKVTVKRSAKKLVLQATLKVNGKAVKGKKITFKFNGKKYTAKTNKKGIAKVTVKKAVLKKLKKGKKIKITATYGKKTAKRTVKVK